jgi:hypothetical protein
MHIKDMQLKTQPSSLDTASIQYPLSIYGPVLGFFLKSRLVLGLELRETNQTKPNQLLPLLGSHGYGKLCIKKY